MSKLMCNKCLTEFKLNYISELHKCPIKNCRGEVVDVDELIFPAILELNKKGYMTKYCCSGHTETNGFNFYVLFKVFYPDLNKYFKNNDFFIIENKIYHFNSIYVSQKIEGKIREWGNMNDTERFELIVKTNLELLKWVKTLPKQEKNMRMIQLIHSVDKKIFSISDHGIYNNNVISFKSNKNSNWISGNNKALSLTIVKDINKFINNNENMIIIDPIKGIRYINKASKIKKEQYNHILKILKNYPEALELYKFTEE